MPPVVLDVQQAEDRRDVVHRAVQALTEGQLVAVPTETVYGLAASALSESAVARLLEVKGHPDGKALPLAIKSADEAVDYVPDISPLGHRLVRRCWPGPVTLVFPGTHPDSLLRKLPPSVLQAVMPSDTVGLRVAGHRLMPEILNLLVGPVVLSGASRFGDPDSLSAAAVVESLGDDVPLVLDDGETKFRQSSTIVKVTAGGYEILREGVVNADLLRRLSSLFIVFVCTGNTCRSPMAELICRNLIAKRLGCPPDELEQQGVIVMSAGLAAMQGGPPSREAVEVMRDHGLDLTSHASQPLTSHMIKQADHLLVMTRAHRNAIAMDVPDVVPRLRLLCANGADVSDPVGGTIDQYRACAEQIERELTQWVAELDL